MYFTNILPSLPTESLASQPAGTVPPRMHSFVDDAEVATILNRWGETDWQEQFFIGEDFAGREDCIPCHVQAHEWRSRQELGPFYSSAESLASAPNLSTCRPRLKASRVESIIAQARIRRRALAVASAAAAMISASILSLWFPHHAVQDLGQSSPSNELQAFRGEKIGEPAVATPAWAKSLLASQPQSFSDE